jgi:hypothetical protein
MGGGCVGVVGIRAGVAEGLGVGICGEDFLIRVKYPIVPAKATRTRISTMFTNLF